MEYKNMRKLFHVSNDEADVTYQSRFSSKDALHIGLSVSGFDAFCVMDSEVYQLILKAERLDKRINALVLELPGKAIEQYMTNCLIDEIVLTNEIEGVNSSRREIGKVLERLEENDRRGRFHGIVEKYLALQRKDSIAIATCADIRKIYDELVLEEVIAEKKENAPDGKFFRAGPVDVFDAAQRPIHHGLEPESKIIETMEVSLSLLNDQQMETLVRVSLFHFLFAYAHPFYDGNGRTNRFISSYVLAREFSPLVGFRLSFSIKEQINKYYKGFSLCEYSLNKGDLTPFVILFSEIIVDAMDSMCVSLTERKAQLERAQNLAVEIPGMREGKDSLVDDRFIIASLLIQAALFAELGISIKEIAEFMKVSVPTVYQRMKFFEEMKLIKKRKFGHSVFYSMDIDALIAISLS